MTRKLRIMYPSNTLQSWVDSTSVSKLPVDATSKDAIAVINIARRFDMMFLAPAAFYILCRDYVTETIVSYQQETEELSREDQQLIVEKRKVLLSWKNKIMGVFSDTTLASPHCQQPTYCFQARLALSHHIIVSDELIKPSPLEDVRVWYKTTPRQAPAILCARCKKSALARADQLREETWLALGPMFGVTTWPQAH